MINIESYPETELSTRIFSDPDLYEKRQTARIEELVQNYIFTDAQLERLIDDLLADYLKSEVN